MANSALFERLALSTPYLTSKLSIPAFLYGTAWKQKSTADLVYQALCNGFTAVDTANQPKHYSESLVGDGLRRALTERKVKRSDIYLQTKFTSVSGQDPNNLPYDPKASVSEQVKASVESSLQHLQSLEPEESYIDALVLHSPLPTFDETLEAWQTLEQYVPGKIRALGISNCNLFTLMQLYDLASIKPTVVQNRFYPDTKFDIALRKFCGEKAIIYQSFWTLTANPGLVRSIEVGELANRLQISTQAALYCLVLGLGNTVVLNGTKSVQHMKDDFEALSRVKALATAHPQDWERLMGKFRMLIGQPES